MTNSSNNSPPNSEDNNNTNNTDSTNNTNNDNTNTTNTTNNTNTNTNTENSSVNPTIPTTPNKPTNTSIPKKPIKKRLGVTNIVTPSISTFNSTSNSRQDKWTKFLDDLEKKYQPVNSFNYKEKEKEKKEENENSDLNNSNVNIDLEITTPSEEDSDYDPNNKSSTSTEDEENEDGCDEDGCEEELNDLKTDSLKSDIQSLLSNILFNQNIPKGTSGSNVSQMVLFFPNNIDGSDSFFEEANNSNSTESNKTPDKKRSATGSVTNDLKRQKMTSMDREYKSFLSQFNNI